MLIALHVAGIEHSLSRNVLKNHALILHCPPAMIRKAHPLQAPKQFAHYSLRALYFLPFQVPGEVDVLHERAFAQ